MRISDWSSDVCSSDLSYATYRRTHTTPAHGTGFAVFTQAVFFVSDFAYGAAAVDVDATDFAGAQAHLSISTFTSHQDSRLAGEIRSAHVLTPVPHAHPVLRLRLADK